MIEFQRNSPNSGKRREEHRVRVLGVGGAGTNVVNRIAQESRERNLLVALNTDARALETNLAPTRIQLGRQTTMGLGCGGDPDMGRQSAEEAVGEIREAVRGASMIFVVAGLGGGTGSGAAPVVARLARETGGFVVAFVTLPFKFQGRRQTEQANAALAELRGICNAVLTFENDRMSELVPGGGIQEAFAHSEQLIGQSIRAITALIEQPGMIRIGMDDLQGVLRGDSARTLFGFGRANGPGRAGRALQAALSNPMLDRVELHHSSKTVLVHISGSTTIKLSEVEEVMEELGKYVNESAQILFGVSSTDETDDHLCVTIISSTGQRDSRASAQPAARQPQPAMSTPVQPQSPPPAVQTPPPGTIIYHPPQQGQIRAQSPNPHITGPQQPLIQPIPRVNPPANQTVSGKVPSPPPLNASSAFIKPIANAGDSRPSPQASPGMEMTQPVPAMKPGLALPTFALDATTAQALPLPQQPQTPPQAPAHQQSQIRPQSATPPQAEVTRPSQGALPPVLRQSPPAQQPLPMPQPQVQVPAPPQPAAQAPGQAMPIHALRDHLQQQHQQTPPANNPLVRPQPAPQQSPVNPLAHQQVPPQQTPAASEGGSIFKVVNPAAGAPPKAPSHLDHPITHPKVKIEFTEDDVDPANPRAGRGRQTITLEPPTPSIASKALNVTPPPSPANQQHSIPRANPPALGNPNARERSQMHGAPDPRQHEEAPLVSRQPRDRNVPPPNGGRRPGHEVDEYGNPLSASEADARGRFDNAEPTIVDGQDLDIPTYLRKKKRN